MSVRNFGLIFVAGQGAAWDHGFDLGFRAFLAGKGKPRNPHTGEMNDDDPDRYCTAHGGTGTPVNCAANPLAGKEVCPGPDRNPLQVRKAGA